MVPLWDPVYSPCDFGYFPPYYHAVHGLSFDSWYYPPDYYWLAFHCATSHTLWLTPLATKSPKDLRRLSATTKLELPPKSSDNIKLNAFAPPFKPGTTWTCRQTVQLPSKPASKDWLVGNVDVILPSNSGKKSYAEAILSPPKPLSTMPTGSSCQDEVPENKPTRVDVTTPSKSGKKSYAEAVLSTPKPISTLLVMPSTFQEVVPENKPTLVVEQLNTQLNLDVQYCRGIVGSWPAPDEMKSLPKFQTKLLLNKAFIRQQNPIRNNATEAAPCGNEEYINGIAVAWERLDLVSESRKCGKNADLERAIKERHWNLKKWKRHLVYERKVRLGDGEIKRQMLTVSSSPRSGFQYNVLSDLKRLDQFVESVCVLDTKGKMCCSNCKTYKPVAAYSKNQWKKTDDIKCRKCCRDRLLDAGSKLEEQ